MPRYVVIVLLLAVALPQPLHASNSEVPRTEKNNYFSGYFMESAAHIADFKLTPNEPIKHGGTTDSVTGIGLALGYHWPGWRLELEYTWRYRFDVNIDPQDYYPNYTNDLETSTLMVNLYRKLLSKPHYSLDLGLGVGSGFNRSKVTMVNYFNDPRGELGPYKEDRRVTNSVWSVSLRGIYHLTSVDLILGYRYIDLGDIKTGPFRESINETFKFTGYEAHDFYVGVAYPF